MKQENALVAEKSSDATSIQTKKPVIGNAQTNYVKIKSIKKVGREPVYNMEVDDTHCFAVNGLIVHNCMDAARYLCETKHVVKMNRKSNKNEYVSPFGR